MKKRILICLAVILAVTAILIAFTTRKESPKTTVSRARFVFMQSDNLGYRKE